MIKRKVAGLVLASGLALAALAATAPQASADHSCPSGYTCAYDAQHRLLYRSAGNANVRLAGGGHVWNNGYRYQGADHISLNVAAYGNRYTICLHYGAWTLSQPDPTVAIIWDQAVITGWRWRGECAESEENWRQY